MENMLLTGEKAAGLLDCAWDLALLAAEAKEREGILTLEIKETEEGYSWRFAGVPGQAGEEVAPVLAKLNDRAGEYGVPFTWSPQTFELNLFLPRSSA